MKQIEFEGDIIYLKKDNIFGWRTVRPIKKNINQPFTWDNIHWKNFLIGGTWLKPIIIGFIIFVLYGLGQEYSSAVKVANDCLLNKTIIQLPF